MPKIDNVSFSGPNEKININIDMKKNKIFVRISCNPLRFNLYSLK